jgi:hypothetical protein
MTRSGVRVELVPSEFQPDELIAAIVAKLKTALEGVAQVKQLAGEDFGANGDLVVKPPVVLVAWVKETPVANRDKEVTRGIEWARVLEPQVRDGEPMFEVVSELAHEAEHEAEATTNIASEGKD